MSNQDEQIVLNELFAMKLKESGVKNLVITSLGNSIASGFSRLTTTKPLLLRNETMDEVLNAYDINVEKHSFARPQNNNDEHFFEWIVSNTPEAEINKFVRSDYSDVLSVIYPGRLDRTKLDEYYPVDSSRNQGLIDIMDNKDKETANVIVYSGCTGSFLDDLTRGGKITHKLTHGFKRDIKNVESILKYIQTYNRKQNTNTQVYLCGVPNFLGLGVSNIVNSRLKKTSKDFANVTYVKPVYAKFRYKDINTGDKKYDIHYDEDEYDKFNNNILRSIVDNYEVNKRMINTDRSLYAQNNLIEVDRNRRQKTPYDLQWIINMVLEKDAKGLTKKEELLYYKKLLKYLLDRSPYDFYYLRKDNIKEVIDRNKKLIK